jgi:hypothetical protein
MQKDLSNATEELAKGLNDMHSNKMGSLINLVKRQAEEIDKRGQHLTHLQETMLIQEENIKLLAQQTKHLETMVQTMQEERQKLLEEIKILKQEKKITRGRKPKEKAGDDKAA